MATKTAIKKLKDLHNLSIGDKVVFSENRINHTRRRAENPTEEELRIFGQEILNKNYQLAVSTMTILDVIKTSHDNQIKIILNDGEGYNYLPTEVIKSK